MCLQYWEIRMKRFIEGADRSQNILFPASLDDYVAEDNAVRVIDVFVDTLKLDALGFEGALLADTCRPAYGRTGSRRRVTSFS
jgi:transposase